MSYVARETDSAQQALADLDAALADYAEDNSILPRESLVAFRDLSAAKIERTAAQRRAAAPVHRSGHLRLVHSAS